MQTIAAAITMVRDDAFFLKTWLRHYGTALGRENCYIVNHGRGAEVAEIAAGCNVIGIPGDPHKNFDMKRWRLLNGLVSGLRGYYNHVIVGDVDELVAVDPAEGRGLLDYLAGMPLRQVLTPVGLEVIHRVDLEEEPADQQILGPRRHVRLAPHYSKPCILSHGTKVARGGHFTQAAELKTPDCLYLFHLKFCDFDTYAQTMDQRNAVTSEIAGRTKDISIGRHWFKKARGEDRAVFEAFADLELRDGFDLTWVRDAMHASWGPRGETGFYQFERPDYAVQYELPDRFFGLF